MFACKLSIHLKPNTLDEFTKTVETDVVPLLRKQAGFQDEITFAAPGGTDVLAISLWDTQKNAENYDNNIYQDCAQHAEKRDRRNAEGWSYRSPEFDIPQDPSRRRDGLSPEDRLFI